MRNHVPYVLLSLIGASVPAIAWESQFPKDLTRSLRNLERQLCQQFSSKCHSQKRTNNTAKKSAKKTSKAIAGQKETKKSQAGAKPALVARNGRRQLAPSKVPIPVPKPAHLREMAGPHLIETADARVQTSQSKTLPRALPVESSQTASLASRVLPPIAQDTVTMEKCLTELQVVKASFAPVDTEDKARGCHVSNPVKVNSVVTAFGKVRLPDQPTLACDFAIQLARWTSENVYLRDGLHITSLWTGPGYQCRGRNGEASGKLSSHAFGNAIDIERFKLSDGSTIWVADSLKPASPGFTLLQKLRASACDKFTTVLGPGTNAAHKSHFHFDLEKRRSGYRICQ